ncbi:MAG: vitamin K epoxide reductase family protein [Vicinamibacteria bacterium]
MPRTRIVIAVLLGGGGLFLALILLSKHYGVPLLGEAVMAACGVGEGCDVVAQSRYSSLFGLPLAAWGLFFYGSLMALLVPSLLGETESGSDPAASMAFFLLCLAIGLDGVLLGLQGFVIKAFCKFCLGTYAVNILMLIALWPFRQVSRAMNFLFVPQGRRALGAWIVATLATFGAAFALNSTLEVRKTLAGASILGVPTMLQPLPAKAEAGSLEEQLAQAHAEAQKWKDTLDSETKLRDYLTNKAKTDFKQSPVVDLQLSKAPVTGSGEAKIVVATFSDFMCPFCRDLARGLHDFVPTTGTSLKVHFKNYPLDNSCNTHVPRTVHQGACELALAGICASDNGRFWEFHDKVFSQTFDKVTRQDALRMAEAVGLDPKKISPCMDSASVKGRLSADIEEAARLDVSSTPTLFVNGHKLPSANVFFIAVDEERKRLGLPVFGVSRTAAGR